MIEKIQITDANVIEQIRNDIPVATNLRKGLYDERYVVKKTDLVITPPVLYKLFSLERQGFSGKITMFYFRTETSRIGEYNIYARSYVNVEQTSEISIRKRNNAGNIKELKFYKDEKYLYAYINQAYSSICCKLDFLINGDLLLEKQSGTDIATLNEVFFTE